MSTGARRCGGLATCWEVPNNESPAGHVSLLRWLALLAITTYLLRRGKPLVYTLVPMVFMLVSTLSAMGSNLIDFWRQGEVILLGTGGGVDFRPGRLAHARSVGRGAAVPTAARRRGPGGAVCRNRGLGAFSLIEKKTPRPLFSAFHQEAWPDEGNCGR